MQSHQIPFSRTTLGVEEVGAITRVIESGWVAMGEKTQEFEEAFAKYVGAEYAVFLDSGTAALFLSLQYLKDKVLLREIPITVPSLTFTSTAEIVIQAGFKVKFADVSREDFCLETVSPYSLPVHLTGNLAKREAIIYDSAHRIARNDLIDAGIDEMWCYSFYATKNMTTIQGGMVATNNKDASIWLKKARDHGMSKGTKERYKDGKWDYEVEFVGWREKPDDVRAAVGLEQLKKLPSMTEERNRVVSRYNEILGLQRTGNHIYPILVSERPQFMHFMQLNGTQTSVHFIPLHNMPAYKDYPRGHLTHTEYLGERLVSLPIYPQLSNNEIEYICQKVKESGLMIKE